MGRVGWISSFAALGLCGWPVRAANVLSREGWAALDFNHPIKLVLILEGLGDVLGGLASILKDLEHILEGLAHILGYLADISEGLGCILEALEAILRGRTYLRSFRKPLFHLLRTDVFPFSDKILFIWEII